MLIPTIMKFTNRVEKTGWWKQETPPQKPSILRTSRWPNAFGVASIRSTRPRSRRLRRNSTLSRFILMRGGESNAVQRIGRERLAHRCDHDEVTRRIRLAAQRGNHRRWWGD